MVDAWHRLAPQLRALPTYEALLRSHELPTLIVSALDAAPTPALHDEQELRAILDILERMIQNKWAFADKPVASEQQRLLDYAHDWASETLLALPHAVAEQDEADGDGSEGVYALDEMQRALFGLRPHSVQGLLVDTEAALTDALTRHIADEMDVESVRQVLETCALSVHEDAEFVQWVERLSTASSQASRGPLALVLGPTCWQRLLAQQKDDHRLLDALSLRARVVLWASDLTVWVQQLDEWLVEVHAAPFRAIPAVLGISHSDDISEVTGASHLHVALVSWATRPSRRRWMRASRSRALVAAVSRMVRDPETDDGAYGRRLLGKVPRVLLASTAISQWTLPQRAHVLQCVAHNLPKELSSMTGTNAREKRRRWLEFFGLTERTEITQSALDALLTHKSDSDSKEWDNARTITAWHECVVYDSKSEQERAIIETAIHETAQGLGMASSWRDAVAWLQQHRSSSFATCTLTRLRITWRWLLRECITGTAVSVSDALESVEYVLRRFAPADDTRRFQLEAIAVLLEDLEWCCGTSRTEQAASSSQQMLSLGAWLQKLVQLLRTTEGTAASASLSQQLEERLQAAMKV